MVHQRQQSRHADETFGTVPSGTKAENHADSISVIIGTSHEGIARSFDDDLKIAIGHETNC